MKTTVGWYLFFALVLFCLKPALCQYTGLVSQIDEYCNTVDQSLDCETKSLSGESISLDYLICGGRTLLITEHSLGYRYLHITTRYYLKESEPVRVNADIEINTDEGNSLTLELHKIWFSGERAVHYMVSEQSFNPDSLFYTSPDPVATAEKVRNDAKFQQRSPDPELIRQILKNVSLYLLHESLRRETLPDTLSSPFI